MRKLLFSLPIVLCFLLHGAPCWATWAVVQAPAPTQCAALSSSCLATVSATGSNNVITATLIAGNQAAGLTVTSCCNSGCAVSWTQGPHFNDVTNKASLEIWYCLKSSSGATSIGASWSAQFGYGITAVREFSLTGLAALDTGATPTCATSSSIGNSNIPECSLTVSSRNDIYVIGASSNTGAIVPQVTNACTNSSYTCTNPEDEGEGYIINQTSYSATSWFNGSCNPTDQWVVAALAIQEAPSSSQVGGFLVGP